MHFFFEAVVEAVPADPRTIPGTTQRSKCGRTTRATWRHHHVERRRWCRRRRCTSASSKGSPSGFEPEFIPVLLDEGPFQSFGFDPIAPLDRSHWEKGQDENLRCFQQQQHVLRETAHHLLARGLANGPYVAAVKVEEDQMPCVELEKDKEEETSLLLLGCWNAMCPGWIIFCARKDSLRNNGATDIRGQWRSR